MHGESLHERLPLLKILTKDDGESRRTIAEYQSYWTTDTRDVKDTKDAEKPRGEHGLQFKSIVNK